MIGDENNQKTFLSNNLIYIYIVNKIYGHLFQAVPINLLYVTLLYLFWNQLFLKKLLKHLYLTFYMIQSDFRNEMIKCTQS